MSADKHRETVDASMIDDVLIFALKDKHDSAQRRTKVSLAEFAEAFRKARHATCSVANCKVLEGGAILLAFAETADL